MPVCRGLIPAHAGKTGAAAAAAARSEAHPRSRGENPLTDSESARATGSSPLTRGKLDDLPSECPDGGLIPAHAGKTSTRMASPERSGAHPRSRGENPRRPPSRGRRLGSSPLTRGKHTRPTPSQSRRGLIPAHAGKTLSYGQHLAATWAHPRSRGENGERSVAETTARGSSPLTRGKHRGPEGDVRGRRLIPAHAGKTRR